MLVVSHETPRFGLHDRFRGRHVLLPFPKPSVLNAVKVIDVADCGGGVLRVAMNAEQQQAVGYFVTEILD